MMGFKTLRIASKIYSNLFEIWIIYLEYNLKFETFEDFNKLTCKNWQFKY